MLKKTVDRVIAPARILERDVEAYLKKEVIKAGGLTRKMQWIGHDGAPDRFVALNGKTFLIELKAPGKKPTPMQVREHEKLIAQGVAVLVIDTLEKVNTFIREMTK